MSHHHKKPRVIENIANTVILESSIHGFGLFTTKEIPKDTLLCSLTGQIVSKRELDQLMREYPRDLFIEKVHLSLDRIMLIPFRTSYSYINHSDTTEMLRISYGFNEVLVYAARDIPYNTEITSRYDLEKHIDVIGGFSEA